MKGLEVLVGGHARQVVADFARRNTKNGVKIQAFWDFTPRNGPLDPEDEGSVILRKVGNYKYLPVYTE
jgi:hypothetical protein